MIVEERNSKRDLTCERSNLPFDDVRFFPVQILKVRPEYLEYQHVVFSIWAMYLKMIQGSDDTIGSRMSP